MTKTVRPRRQPTRKTAVRSRAKSGSASAAIFPIVGLGASAGGLEALELFLKNVPPASGSAYVIVQHLDPTHPGVMPELLQRLTPMPVRQVHERMRVQPDCVYVIPPNKDLSLLHGVLHLLDPAAPRGLRLPVDFFFRSLAEDQRERSVGVILSGMGSDGTLGLKAIKEHGGVGLVQAPNSAKFDGMPRSAIDAGLADIVAPVAELPARMLAYFRHTPLLSGAAGLAESGAESEVEKVVILLRSHTGHDFSLYKRNTLYRRIERRMGLHQLAKISLYVRYLRANPQEADLLFKELLIGVTSFFREPAVWDQMSREALPPLLARTPGQALRAWVPGCSTGEEAYSLAIIFCEALERVSPKVNFSLQIFATDLDPDAVAKARQGFYPAAIHTHVSPERLRRFFVEENDGYRVAKKIREMVIFAPQNITMDPPFTKLDLLSCRNLLIYFAPELQQKLLPLFHYSLKPDGVLLLGSAESVGGFGHLFAALPGRTRIFRRRELAQRLDLVEFPSAFVADVDTPKAVRPAVPAPDGLQSLAEHWLLQHHAPAAVLVNEEGDILFISGRTGAFLEPAAGKANWNIFVMARADLRYELTSTFQKARRQSQPVSSGPVATANPRDGSVNLTVTFLQKPGPLCGLAMVVFTATGPAAKGRAPKSARHRGSESALKRELQAAREEMQTTREEMQSSQEELKSMNEELQSTNEELQSTNEELTTSKEEMQSLNEELQTVNAELQTKVDELTAASGDM